MSFVVNPVVVGLLEANCYILTADNGDMAIIDPGDDADKILSRIPDKSKVKYILATHAHIDHISALPEVKANCPKAQVYIPKKDLRFAKNPRKNVLVEGAFPNYGIRSKDLRKSLKIPFGSDYFEVIKTPGHTPGSVCLLLGKTLFTGDTLFYHSLGVAYFPGGDAPKLAKTKKKLSKLSDDIIVYPGHLRKTSIRLEKEAGIL